MLWLMKGDRLWRISTSLEGEPQDKLAVPTQSRGALIRRFHHLCHRGHDPLYETIQEHYYWPSMQSDCADFTQACSICGELRSHARARAPVEAVPTPSRPFNVIHVDHKGPLPRSGKYTNILVVVCALTRYTLYIPVVSTTAEETLKVLLARVFCVFGYPLVMVSDNGPAFVSGLQQQMAAFFGFRHIPILPYNAAANGVAESSVKRIKLLLDRHLDGYADWHKILPLAQLQLNCHVHTGLRTSPYMALFGHQPIGIEVLENPALLPKASSGSEWLREIRSRITRIQREIRKASDAIKEARAAEANARQRCETDNRSGPIVASTPGDPRYVRLLKGSEEDAKYIRKHGHGEPWKHRYKVLEVRPHAVRLEVPKDKSVPIIGEWQLIRRCEPAPSELVLPSSDDPKMTDSGIPLFNSPTNGPTWDPDQVFEIDKVLSAEKCGTKYRLWIKWKDWADATPMWRHELIRQNVNPELRQEIDDAVRRCREQLNLRGDAPDDPHDSSSDQAQDRPSDADGNQDNSDPPETRGHPGRSRRAPRRYTDAFTVIALTSAVFALTRQCTN